MTSPAPFVIWREVSSISSDPSVPFGRGTQRACARKATRVSHRSSACRGHHSITVPPTVHSSPNRLAIRRLTGGSALITRIDRRESISDGRLSVTVWCIAFNELRTARKP